MTINRKCCTPPVGHCFNQSARASHGIASRKDARAIGRQRPVISDKRPAIGIYLQTVVWIEERDLWSLGHGRDQRITFD